MRRVSVQAVHLGLESVADDALVLRGGERRAVLEVGSLNFALQGESEREETMAGFAAFLNGLSFLAVSPTGAACGPVGTRAEVFGCLVTADRIVIRDPAPGRWALFLVTPTGGSPTLTVDLFTGTTRTAARALSRPFNPKDQIRSA